MSAMFRENEAASPTSERTAGEEALRAAALAVSSAKGEAVFPELVRCLATLLKVEIVFIALPLVDDPCRLRMLAFYLDGSIRENFDYPMAGTPCETVIGQSFRAYPSGLRERFPLDTDFAALKVESYAGYPLTDSHDQPLGLISIVSRRPLPNPDRIESILQIFAVRVAAEIEQARAQEALRASEEQYRSIFNAALAGLALIDAERRIVDVNPAFIELFGYRRDELTAMLPESLLPLDGQDSGRDILAPARRGRPVRGECAARHRDGHSFDIELQGVPMQYGGRPHLLLVVRDITERKNAEEERSRLEAQLRQAQKMEAIGHLTGGIAHDFNNILTSVMGYVVLGVERAAELGDAKLGRYLEQANLAAQRARDLIQQMLTFSRGQRGERRALSLPPLIGESVKLLHSMLPSTVELATELADDVRQVMMNPVQVEQILFNLCLNACDAISGAGTIRVSVRRAHIEACVCASCRERFAGDFVELCVSDSGVGIAAATMERMFEPFFSTKEVGHGSGMGLAVVHGIVHEHGGHIAVDSGPSGTRFRIYLPPVQAAGATAPENAAGAIAGTRRPRLSGHVLLVEDEQMVSEFIVDLLTDWGLEVTAKADALQAESWFAEDPDRVDLVLTDQTMPKRSGLDLAQRLTAIRPGLPLILYTGYDEAITEESLARHGVSALLRKPVDPAALFALLHDRLAPVNP